MGRVDNVEYLAAEPGCQIGSIPSTYLGLLLGVGHKLVAIWIVLKKGYADALLFGREALYQREGE